MSDRAYPIVIGRHCLPRLGRLLKSLAAVRRIVIVSAPPVYRRYGRAILASLNASGFEARVVTVPDGERAKSLRWLSYLYDRLVEARCDRDVTVIALGGGVIGDLAGFAASTYLRGVRVVQVPTTLVAQVDASIGGKTAVNHPNGKNLIGTFHQPALVLADVAVLRTLPTRDLVGGLAEVVKYGVIADPALFQYLERHAPRLLACDLAALERIVVRSAAIKADVVGRDEREGGLRRILNYGHTLGHAVETVTGYRRVHHGEAIAIGMAFAARLGVRLGLCGWNLVERQDGLLRRIGLPARLPQGISTSGLMSSMAHDKKVRGGRLHFVLPRRVGAVVVRAVDTAEVRRALTAFAADRPG